jgi:transcription termination/antitermination protein NusG
MSQLHAVVESAESAVQAAPANPDLRWYVVHAYSGMEKAVERNIQEGITHWHAKQVWSHLGAH